MGRKLFWIICFLFSLGVVQAQRQAFVHEGEIGFTAGAAHYFGDLNNQASFKRPKQAFGVFFRKQFGNYVGVRLGIHYAQLGYADKYSTNAFQLSRNLSFNTDLWEYSLQGDFNFFRFVPGDVDYRFTPYVTLGIGSMSFDPYAYLQGEKYYLRSLGTEGQGSVQYPDRLPYKNTSMVFPLGMGMKYNVNHNINVHLEIAYRFTDTDYLDDVSTTFAGSDIFDPQSPSYFLQDRSYEVGQVIGEAGRQRGFSAQKDQYIFAEFGISVNLSSYRCPSPSGSRR
ncbi:MAG: DUF6089 family protein [Sphingobacteriales bacterium]